MLVMPELICCFLCQIRQVLSAMRRGENLRAEVCAFTYELIYVQLLTSFCVVKLVLEDLLALVH